jgi:hypothetical protein
MGLLDRLLSTRNTTAAQDRNTALKGFMNANRVTAMNSNGIQIGRADTRASSALARDVVGELTGGNVPASMYQTVDNGSNMFFRKDSNAYKELTKAGIGVGSSVEELNAFLKQRAAKKQPGTSNSVGNTNADKPGLNRDLNTTGPVADTRTSDSSRQNMIDGYQTGYGQGQSSTTQDFFQLDLGVNRAYEDFQRMLHNSLFQ